MHTQVLIVLVDILFCATTMQGRRLSHQERHESKYDADRHFARMIQPLYIQKGQHVYRKLEQNRRDSDDEQRQFQEQMLEAHNQYRAQHCAPPLTLDDELNDGAQQYAEYLVEIDSLVHSGADGLGENLYMSGSSDAISGDNGKSIFSIT